MIYNVLESFVNVIPLSCRTFFSPHPEFQLCTSTLFMVAFTKALPCLLIPISTLPADMKPYPKVLLRRDKKSFCSPPEQCFCKISCHLPYRRTWVSHKPCTMTVEMTIPNKRPPIKDHVAIGFKTKRADMQTRNTNIPATTSRSPGLLFLRLVDFSTGILNGLSGPPVILSSPHAMFPVLLGVLFHWYETSPYVQHILNLQIS